MIEDPCQELFNDHHNENPESNINDDQCGNSDPEPIEPEHVLEANFFCFEGDFEGASFDGPDISSTCTTKTDEDTLSCIENSLDDDLSLAYDEFEIAFGGYTT